jgi:hypothetical protein
MCSSFIDDRTLDGFQMRTNSVVRAACRVPARFGTLVAVASSIALMGCGADSGEGPDGAQLITGPREVCYAVTLDLSPGSVAETNHVLSARRYLDREPMCWTFDQQRGDTPDAVTFTLSRTFAIDGDGTRLGCRFTGQGNALRASVTTGECAFPTESGHLRMALAEPADLQIQDIHSSLVALDLDFEEVRDEWVRTRGTARLSMANQDSVLQGLERGESDLDPEGPDEDPWVLCPQVPICFDADFTGSGELVGDSAADDVCADWIAPLQYREMPHRIDTDGNLDWGAEGSTIYRAVRALDGCRVLGFADSMDTRDDYIADFDEGTFRMELRAIHQAQVGGVPRTASCHGVWTGPLTVKPCP